MTRDTSLLVTVGIPLLACATVAAIAFAIGTLPEDGPRRARRFLLAASVWYAVALALAGAGILRDPNSLPPPILLVMLPTLLLPTWLAWSKVGTALVDHVPVAWLVGFHAFRLPLELVMHRAASEGTMPEQMTFTGLNFDVLTGITALVVGILAAKGLASRALIVAFNLLGTTLLVTIGAIAIASLPAFHAFGTDPSRLNTWVAEVPFVLLPAGLVASAAFGHLLLFRFLARHPATEGGTARFVNERQGAADPN
jgi:hypothetical protein